GRTIAGRAGAASRACRRGERAFRRIRRMSDSRADQPGRVERLAEALRVPVLIAAAASVPAVFLSPLDGPLGAVGTLINWVSMLVLTGESALLFFRNPDRSGWL